MKRQNLLAAMFLACVFSGCAHIHRPEIFKPPGLRGRPHHHHSHHHHGARHYGEYCDGTDPCGADPCGPVAAQSFAPLYPGDTFPNAHSGSHRPRRHPRHSRRHSQSLMPPYAGYPAGMAAGWGVPADSCGCGDAEFAGAPWSDAAWDSCGCGEYVPTPYGSASSYGGTMSHGFGAVSPTWSSGNCCSGEQPSNYQPMPSAPGSTVPSDPPDNPQLPIHDAPPAIPDASVPKVQHFSAPARTPETAPEEDLAPMPPSVQQTLWMPQPTVTPAKPATPAAVRQSGGRVMTRRIAGDSVGSPMSE